MSSSDLFVSAEGAEWVNPEPGVVRRIMTYLPEMMLVEVAFESGAVGAAHSHPHIQASYVAEGSFEVTIDGRTESAEAGRQLHRAPQSRPRRQGAGKGPADRCFHPASGRIPEVVRFPPLPGAPDRQR